MAGAVKECCLQCFSPAPLYIKGSSAPSEQSGRTLAGQAGQESLEISLGQIFSPCNYAGIHLLSKAVFSQGERLPSLCLIMHTRVEKAQLSSVKHKHLSSSCLHRKEFHSLCYSRAVVPFDNSRSHTHSVCPYFVQVLCDTCC